MRQSPYAHEYSAAPNLNDQALLEYFLTRCFETDEVWLLADDEGFMLRRLSEKNTLPVWPYRRFASDAALDYWLDSAPTSVSLDYFLEKTLPSLANSDVAVEIMPRGNSAGCLVTAKQLAALLQGLVDAGEYRLDS